MSPIYHSITFSHTSDDSIINRQLEPKWNNIIWTHYGCRILEPILSVSSTYLYREGGGFESIVTKYLSQGPDVWLTSYLDNDPLFPEMIPKDFIPFLKINRNYRIIKKGKGKCHGGSISMPFLRFPLISPCLFLGVLLLLLGRFLTLSP